MGVAKSITEEIRNLLYLYLEHNDPPIRNKLRETIIQKIPFGYHPFFFIENIENPIVRFQLRKELESLNLEKIVYDFQNYYFTDTDDLMKGSFLVSRFSDSLYLDFDLYKRKFFILVKEFLKIHSNFANLPSEEKFYCIHNFLFHLKKYSGNTEDYYNLENNFLALILNSKKGNPVTLSVLVLLFYKVLKKILESTMNQKIDFTITGINLPGHFIVSFRSKDYSTLFDPFHQGNPISYEDCCKYLLANGYDIDITFFSSVPTLVIIRRMLKNLLNYYNRTQNLKKEKTIEILIKNLNNLIQVEEKNL